MSRILNSTILLMFCLGSKNQPHVCRAVSVSEVLTLGQRCLIRVFCASSFEKNRGINPAETLQPKKRTMSPEGVKKAQKTQKWEKVVSLSKIVNLVAEIPPTFVQPSCKGVQRGAPGCWGSFVQPSCKGVQRGAPGWGTFVQRGAPDLGQTTNFWGDFGFTQFVGLLGCSAGIVPTSLNAW